MHKFCTPARTRLYTTSFNGALKRHFEIFSERVALCFPLVFPLLPLCFCSLLTPIYSWCHLNFHMKFSIQIAIRIRLEKALRVGVGVARVVGKFVQVQPCSIWVNRLPILWFLLDSWQASANGPALCAICNLHMHTSGVRPVPSASVMFCLAVQPVLSVRCA